MGKLIIEIPPITEKDCYYLQERTKPCFNYPLHKHEAFELNYVEHCKGARRIVGDSIEELQEYDLALVGSNLEHVWEQHNCEEGEIHEITIQFPPNFFAMDLLNRQVMKPLKDMMEVVEEGGVAFGMKAIMTVYSRLISLASAEPSYHSLSTMMGILYDLAESGDYHKLSSSSYSHVPTPKTSRRIQKITDYVDQHYEQEIRMEQLAALVGMTPNALSRFFKQHTNRSVSSYINEVRIGKATQLLTDSTMTILEISYKCGFNTISNFNRTFKSLKGLSPTEFREIYKKNIYFV